MTLPLWEVKGLLSQGVPSMVPVNNLVCPSVKERTEDFKKQQDV